jgi:hypothetical protein
MINKLKWSNLQDMGFKDLKFKSSVAGMYSVSAVIDISIGKKDYTVNINAQSRKTVSRVMTISLACQAILDVYNSFLEMPTKDKMIYIQESGSKLYESE